MLDDLTNVPPLEEDSWYYQDWGDTRTYSIGDIGKGECAGEIVSATIIEVAAAEREVFEAQIALEEERINDAVGYSYRAIVRAARALVREEYYDIPENPDIVVKEFKTRYFERELFSPQFANYFFTAHQDGY